INRRITPADKPAPHASSTGKAPEPNLPHRSTPRARNLRNSSVYTLSPRKAHPIIGPFTAHNRPEYANKEGRISPALPSLVKGDGQPSNVYMRDSGVFTVHPPSWALGDHAIYIMPRNSATISRPCCLHRSLGRMIACSSSKLRVLASFSR